MNELLHELNISNFNPNETAESFHKPLLEVPKEFQSERKNFLTTSKAS